MTAGMSSAIRSAMMPMTTTSSISENPWMRLRMWIEFYQSGRCDYALDIKFFLIRLCLWSARSRDAGGAHAGCTARTWPQARGSQVGFEDRTSRAAADAGGACDGERGGLRHDPGSGRR